MLGMVRKKLLRYLKTKNGGAIYVVVYCNILSWVVH